MAKFDVFEAYVSFEQASHEGKNRPVVIVDLRDFEKPFGALAIYSDKPKFHANHTQKFYQSFLYEIEDILSAGLNKKSFVDVRVLIDYTFQQIMFNAKYRGKLSAKDASGLIDKLEDYHSANL
ncbi:hypothetical protein FACS1894193_04700 [Bacilli bacterium]|nr:hypothetical protein FACS1894192_07730 [Bacilli bacterium]GHU41219.1 hypothetical protein FACS1894193_04700 [Bacilli bacterium]